jgi:hypothetical protein
VDATPEPDPRDRVIEQAVEILRQHTPDADGWCRGCIYAWGRLTFFEQCAQAQWASAVRAAYAEGRLGDGPATPSA